MTKRAMEAEREAKLARTEESKCGCYYNWDDKFEVLCDEHQSEIEVFAETVYPIE